MTWQVVVVAVEVLVHSTLCKVRDLLKPQLEPTLRGS